MSLNGDSHKEVDSSAGIQNTDALIQKQSDNGTAQSVIHDPPHTEAIQEATPTYSNHHTLEQLILIQQQQISKLLEMLPTVSPTPPPPIPSTTPGIQPTFSLPPLDQLLPKFGGRDEEDPMEFLDKFTDAYHAYHVPEQTWKTTVRNQLLLTARQWFDRHTARFSNFETFSELFKQHFNSASIQTRLKANFYGQSQAVKENSEDFVNAKLKIYHRLFPDNSEEQTLSDIIQLLHPSIQVHLLQTPTSIDDLLMKLEIIDRSLACEQASQTYKHNAPPYQPYNRYNGRHNQFEKHSGNDKTNTLDKQNVPDKHNAHLEIRQMQTPLKNCPAVNILVFNKSISAYLDTGANASFINADLLPVDTQLFDSEEEVSLAASKFKQSCKAVNVDFKLGKSLFHHKFYILKDMITPILLGYDWIETNQAIIDTHSKLLIYGETREIMPLSDQTANNKECRLDIDKVKHSFPTEHAEEFYSILQDFGSLFVTNPLQQTNGIAHKIILTDQTPINTPQYKLSPDKQAFVVKQIREMETQNLIEPSLSPYNSPLVVVTHDDKEPRMCTDYRKLNQVTADSYCPSLNISELVKNIGKNKVFCKLDLKKGYWQVPMEQNSKAYTAFTGPDGRHWQYRVMPFGLKGSPSTFMHLMQKVLQNYLGTIADVFLDDVIIKADNYENLLHNLKLVLERFRIFNLTLSLDKCEFGVNDVEYLGHQITATQNFASSHHAKAIQNQKYPKTKKDLQSFLGICTWLRDYVTNAAETLEPLYKMLSRKPFKWNDSDNEKFDEVKKVFANLQPLHRPDPDRPFILQTDGSLEGLGACLYQEGENGKQIVANISTTLNDTEKRYHSNEIECLAIVWAVKKFRIYLEGKKFTLRTDNKALTWLNNFKDNNAKLLRWSLILAEFNFNIEHVPGKANELPDALSRNPEVGDTEDGMKEEMFVPVCTDKDIPSLNLQLISIDHTTLFDKVKAAQLQDEDIAELVYTYEKILKTPSVDLTPKQTKFLTQYQVIHGYLYTRRDEGDEWKLVVPQSMVSQVMEYYHNHELYFHPGINATIILIKQYFFWTNMAKDVALFIKACHVCIQTKVAGRNKISPLHPRQETKIFQTWSLDIMGPYIPSRKKQNAYLITMTDICSKWIEAKAVKKADTKTILDFMDKEVFSRFGYPSVILTDNGSQFRSQEWANYCQQHLINHHTTAIYTARQNPVERKNQCIKTRMRMHLLENNHNRWDEKLHQILFSIRSVVNQATKKTPAEVVFNQNLRSPLERYPTSKSSSRKSHFQAAKRNQKIYNKKQYKVKPFLLYKENSIVYIRNHTLSSAEKDIVASLCPRWIGPYEIRDVHPSGVYKCQAIEDARDVRKVSHGDIQLIRTPHSTQDTLDLDSNISDMSTDYQQSLDTPSTHSDSQDMHSTYIRETTSYPQPNPLSCNEPQSQRIRRPNPRYVGPDWDV
ncbi:hypothetical protein M8J77_013460 [Diaphorina citri]|nr:hypothetical protein M8J77_013460 [Diaphorina citri]